MEKRKKVYFGNLWIWWAKRLPWDRSGCGGSGCSQASSSLFNVTCHSVQTVRVRVLCSGENYVNETKNIYIYIFFYLYHKLLQHSFSKHIKQAKIKNNRKINTKRVLFSFPLQYYITWLCQAMDVFVLPCVKSSLFATLEDLQGDVWFWFAHRWKTTTSSGEMLFTAQTKLLTQEFPWSYTLRLKLQFDLALSSPRLKAYILYFLLFLVLIFFVADLCPTTSGTLSLFGQVNTTPQHESQASLQLRWRTSQNPLDSSSETSRCTTASKHSKEGKYTQIPAAAALE